MSNQSYQMKYTRFPCMLYGTYYDSVSKKVYDDIAEGFADGVPHAHAETELLHVTCGSAVVEIDGEQCALHTDDLLIVNPFETHRLLYTSQRRAYGHFRMRFRASMLLEDGAQEIADTIARLEHGELKFRRHFSASDLARNQLLSDFRALCNIINSRPAGWEFGLKARFYTLFFDLINGGFLTESVGTVNVGFSDRVTAYVERHCTEDISVTDAALALGYSKSYFCRLFRETMRISFTDYLHLTRINRARRRMAEGETDISRLALEEGYNSLSYFSKIFRRCTGETPTEFCRRVQSGDIIWNDGKEDGNENDYGAENAGGPQ